MLTIFKYPINPGRTYLVMPSDAKPLTVQIQHGDPMLWVLVDASPTKPVSSYTVDVYGTGHSLPENPGNYIASFQINGGSLVWHAFMATTPSL